VSDSLSEHARPSQAAPTHAAPTHAAASRAAVGVPPRHRASRSGWAARRWLTAAGWTAGGAALLVLFVRIALSFPVNSDESGNALHAWAMLHGQVLLHGWILGDVTFYTMELPIIAVSELFFGLSDLSSSVAAALVYLIVAALAVALALRGSSGAARLARCGAALAVLAIPLAVPYGLWVELGPPDHMGTSAFLLLAFLLIDIERAPRYTAPVVGLILCLGQLSDATVRYVAVPAIILVSLYHMVVARRIRTADTAMALAAIVSVPAENALRAVLLHFGAYLMIDPRSKIAPSGKWWPNTKLAWDVLRELFGGTRVPHAPLGGALTILGLIALLAAAAGLVAVGVRWRTASRADQLLALAIVFNLAAYIFSNFPTTTDSHEIAIVLPCGAVLAARLLVPARIKARIAARAAVAAAAVAALVPLATASTFAPATEPSADLIPWLEAHHLSYGLAGYWQASAATQNAGGEVNIRPIAVRGNLAWRYNWESNLAWYDASKYDATFVAVTTKHSPSATAVEGAFGKPAYLANIPGWEILVYNHNLLGQVKPTPLKKMA
jgi:hypothetical protein